MSSAALPAEAPLHNAQAAHYRTRSSGASPPPPPPRCATDVIQFIFMRGRTKLLRFDWPHDPAFDSLHGHMTFGKLAEVVAEHVGSLRASRDEDGPTAASDDAMTTHPQDAPCAVEQSDAAKADENASELIRRELQRSAASGTAAQISSYSRPFEELKVYAQALTADGVVPVEMEEQWEAVKKQIADTAWLEGCLRVVVDVL
jgi:hypothetical protein